MSSRTIFLVGLFFIFLPVVVVIFFAVFSGDNAPLRVARPLEYFERSQEPVVSGSAGNLFELGVGDAKIRVELADTPPKRSRGLSGRTSLPQDQGLFFVFDSPGFYDFWMPDMNFSIDIIWIDENYKIVDISPSVSPDTYPATFSPALPVLYVLETNAGWAEAHNVEVGAQILIDI